MPRSFLELHINFRSSNKRGASCRNSDSSLSACPRFAQSPTRVLLEEPIGASHWRVGGADGAVSWLRGYDACCHLQRLPFTHLRQGSPVVFPANSPSSFKFTSTSRCSFRITTDDLNTRETSTIWVVSVSPRVLARSPTMTTAGHGGADAATVASKMAAANAAAGYPPQGGAPQGGQGGYVSWKIVKVVRQHS